MLFSHECMEQGGRGRGMEEGGRANVSLQGKRSRLLGKRLITRPSRQNTCLNLSGDLAQFVDLFFSFF